MNFNLKETSTPTPPADIRNKPQSFFTILEKFEKKEEVPKKIVSAAKRDLKILLKLFSED